MNKQRDINLKSDSTFEEIVGALQLLLVLSPILAFFGLILWTLVRGIITVLP